MQSADLLKFWKCDFP